jgi:hypothetical protein
MRFMLFIYPGIDESEWSPSADDVRAMMQYNEELTKAGALLALDGLLPPTRGASVTRSGGRTAVVDGPYAEAKEVVGGYWVIQAKSLEEAVQWATRCPLSDGNRIEVRQVAEMSDFSEEVQQVDTSGVKPLAQ